MGPKPDKLKVLRLNLESNINILNRFENYLNNSPSDIIEIQLRLTRAEPLLNKIEQVQFEINSLGIASFDDDSEGKEKDFYDCETYENTYYRVISRAKHLLDTLKPSNQETEVFANNRPNKQIKKFWELEEIPKKQQFSAEEQSCEDHFVNNFQRTTEGRFIVRLPFKNNKYKLGNSFNRAMSNFYSCEKRLLKAPETRESYIQFMKEYLQLGHMELVNLNTSTFSRQANNEFFLPHHCVTKETSLSTKLRVVFNGSSKSSTGISLNDTLKVGPTIQLDIFSILLRFRTHQIAFTADISKMYRQILLHPDDRDFQKILWRENPSEQLKIFRLNTVTYGTSCAPFLAIRCLFQLANDHENTFPHAAAVIKNEFYVDDLISGAPSIEKAMILKQQLIEILQRGGFTLCKWASNKPELLLNSDSGENEVNLNLDQDQNSRTLGLVWNSQQDVFKFVIKQPYIQSQDVSKRELLSQISLIFDPLGVINPVSVLAKSIMQKVWTFNLAWDDPIPENLKLQWLELRQQLNFLNHFNIPPKMVVDNIINYAEIHGFCDASQTAYGACIYIKTINMQNNISVSLVCAKSRVSPLKVITIPRLELCGAQLLAKLVQRVHSIINIKIQNIYLWTDSTIVLAWLSQEPSKLKTFVSNRVVEIQNLTSNYIWLPIPGELNPADILSRGMLPNDLFKSKLWWYGPQFLRLNNSSWPIHSQVVLDKIPELKTNTCSVNHTSINCDLFLRYSSFKRLTRIVAYIFRLRDNILNKNNKNIGTLTFNEIEQAALRVVKIVQSQNFSPEIQQLKEMKPLGKSSKLISLNPFLDEQGLIRVGGRLNNSTLSQNQKHPLVIPKNHHITKIIISDIHTKFLHAGNQATLAEVRKKFWPLSGRDAVRSVLRKCITCFRVKPVSTIQLMGNLPKYRTQPSRPFLNCAVDYAGPINIKNGFGRTTKLIKSYIALFICLSTKAIHIELVCDCTTETFLSALKRMTARRGKPLNIFSDNGTNFVGADRELQKIFKTNLFKNKVVDNLENDNIHWHFIPSKSPHMGGLWEAGIKSAKTHIKKITKNALLNYEEFYTLLTEIEACLNSRPLYPISNDPNDLSPLTPAHFLVGDPLTSIPEDNFVDVPKNRLNHWQRIMQLKQHFWQHWSTEYLHELQQRNKWQFSTNQNIVPGALVILKEENLAPLAWRMGRILTTFPGKDGHVRVVSVKTSGGVVKRALSKICLLPIE